MKKGFWSFPKVSFAKEMKVIVERRLLFFVALLEARWEFRRLSWLYHPFLWLISVEGGGVGPLLRLACLLLASVCIQHFWWQKQATSPIYRETCAWHFLHTFSLQHQIYQRQKSSDEDKLSKHSLKRQSAVVLDRFPHTIIIDSIWIFMPFLQVFFYDIYKYVYYVMKLKQDLIGDRRVYLAILQFCAYLCLYLWCTTEQR